MSNLDKLLEGLEVEWQSIEKIITDKFWLMPSTPKFYEDEEIPYITSKNIRGGHINFDKAKLISRTDFIELSRNRAIKSGDILISMIGTIGEVAIVKQTDLEFYGQNMYLLRLNSDIIIAEFFLHYFDSPRMKHHFDSIKNNSGQGYLKSKDIESLQIPIPCPNNPIKSLEIQKEIVRILDTFTERTENLVNELTTELEARKKQYSYYRDKLFKFDEKLVKNLPLGHDSIGKFIRGGGLQKKDFTESGIGCIHYGQIYTHYGTFANRTKTFISEEFAKKARMAKHGDLVVATTSENDEDVCKAVAWLGNEEIAVSSDACFYTHSLNPKYVAYFFQTEQFQKQKRSFITGTKVRRVNADDLAKIKIPVLSSEEQERIVIILDKLDSLTTSISEALLKEIALRKKQYEYYRDLLLTFPTDNINA